MYDTKKEKQTRIEALLVLFGLMFLFRLGNSQRHLPILNDYLSLIVGLFLLYAPFLHVSLRKIDIVFFERSFRQVLYSLRIFIIFSLIVFSLFLVAAHVYQTLLLGLRFEPNLFSRNMESLTAYAVLYQILMVALPEEVFFRGYLQSILVKRYSKKITVLPIGGLAISQAVVITSVLFALSHSIIAWQWWHFAIFFPSLAFGFLREKTNGLLAPILFHSCCNLLISWIGRFYV